MYDAIGGQPTVDGMVGKLFDRLLADDTLARYYATAGDLDALRDRYRHFFTTAFDGPGEWTGPLMTPVHAGRGINDSEWDTWCAHLLAALAELGVHPAHQATITAEVLDPLRPHIVGQ